jgi:hypothetical protein
MPRPIPLELPVISALRPLMLSISRFSRFLGSHGMMQLPFIPLVVFSKRACALIVDAPNLIDFVFGVEQRDGNNGEAKMEATNAPSGNMPLRNCQMLIFAFLRC